MMIKDKILVYSGKKLICFSHILIAIVYKFFLFFFLLMLPKLVACNLV